MNKAGHVYEEHFIIPDLLIESAIADEVQSELACANLQFCHPRASLGTKSIFYGFKMQKKNNK